MQLGENWWKLGWDFLLGVHWCIVGYDLPAFYLRTTLMYNEIIWVFKPTHFGHNEMVKCIFVSLFTTGKSRVRSQHLTHKYIVWVIWGNISWLGRSNEIQVSFFTVFFCAFRFLFLACPTVLGGISTVCSILTGSGDIEGSPASSKSVCKTDSSIPQLTNNPTSVMTSVKNMWLPITLNLFV